MTPWAKRSIVDNYRIAPAKEHVVGLRRNHTACAAERDWSVPWVLFIGVHPLDLAAPARPDAGSCDKATRASAVGCRSSCYRRRFVTPSFAEAAGIAYV